MKKILNLTQHKASAEQIEAGVVDLNDAWFADLGRLLTFDEAPDMHELMLRAHKIALLAQAQAEPCDVAMIGGAPYLMSYLEKALKDAGIKPVYAFTKRVSVEKDGVKTSVFKHLGFVRV